MQEVKKTIISTITSQLVGASITGVIVLVGYLISLNYWSADLIKRVAALENESVKREVYNNDQKHISITLEELKKEVVILQGDIKTLLTRSVSSR